MSSTRGIEWNRLFVDEAKKVSDCGDVILPLFQKPKGIPVLVQTAMPPLLLPQKLEGCISFDQKKKGGSSNA